jgi:hypothetical protein
MDKAKETEDSSTINGKGHSKWSHMDQTALSPLVFQGCPRVHGFTCLKSQHAYMDDVVAFGKI